MEEKEAFEKMAKAVEEYITKYGNPHITIIATQNGIEVMEGKEAKPFELKD